MPVPSNAALSALSRLLRAVCLLFLTLLVAVPNRTLGEEEYVNPTRITYRLYVETKDSHNAESAEDMKIQIHGTLRRTGDIRFKRYWVPGDISDLWKSAILSAYKGLVRARTAQYDVPGSTQASTHTGRPIRIVLTNPGDDDWDVGTVRIDRLIDGSLQETSYFDIDDSIGDESPQTMVEVVERNLKGKRPQAAPPQEFTLDDQWVVFNHLDGSADTREKTLSTTFTKGIWEEKTREKTVQNEITVSAGGTAFGVDMASEFKHSQEDKEGEGEGKKFDFSKSETEKITVDVPEATLLLQRHTWVMTGTRYTWGNLAQWTPDLGSIRLRAGEKHEFVRDQDDDTRLVNKYNSRETIPNELLEIARPYLGSSLAGATKPEFRARVIAKAWPGLPSYIGAAVENGRGKTFFFKQNRYWRFDNDSGKMDAGYPREIDSGWPGIPNHIEAAVNSDNEKMLLFKGTRVWSWDISEDTLDDGYPKPIADEFPGIPARLDCAVRAGHNPYGENVVTFFKGQNFWMWNLDTGKLERGPESISRVFPKKLPPANLDAATSAGLPYIAELTPEAVFGRYHFLRQEESWSYR